jgi:tRNA (guanine37-N1)-methyltransferase
MWQVNILTLFPEIYPGPLKFSTSGKAMDAKFWELNTKNIRDFYKKNLFQIDSQLSYNTIGSHTPLVRYIDYV